MKDLLISISAEGDSCGYCENLRHGICRQFEKRIDNKGNRLDECKAAEQRAKALKFHTIDDVLKSKQSGLTEE